MTTSVEVIHSHDINHYLEINIDMDNCWYLLTLIEKIRKRTDTAVAFTRRF
jgi:hypothetical protein